MNAGPGRVMHHRSTELRKTVSGRSPSRSAAATLEKESLHHCHEKSGAIIGSRAARSLFAPSLGCGDITAVEVNSRVGEEQIFETFACKLTINPGRNKSTGSKEDRAGFPMGI